MLETLNPFIRYARVQPITERSKNTCVGFDNRLFFCLEGSFRIVAQREFLLHESEALFIPQYTPYRFLDIGARILSINFDLSADFAAFTDSHGTHETQDWDGTRLYEETPLPYLDAVVKMDASQVRGMLLHAAEVFGEGKPFGCELAGAYLKCALLGMISERREPHHPAVLHAMELVRERYSMDFTAGELASEIGYNESYLNRLMKAQLGMRLGEYITGYRIGQAKKLLADGMNVTQTATACGFSDLSYFSHCFKRNVGMTPGEYRRSTQLV